jgi:glycosyltransferase involved in cell wall biosynthesis
MLSKRATGLSSYIVDLTQRLLDDGHSVTILATDCGYRGEDAGELASIDSRARVIVFPVQGRLNRKLYRSSELVKWFGAHVHEFDLLDIQGIWAIVNVEVARIARAAALPYVVTPHGMLTKWDWGKRRTIKKTLYGLGAARMLSHSACVRFLSAGEADNTAKALNARSTIIPNAVEPRAGIYTGDIRKQVCERFNINPKDNIVLFIGRVCHQKGVLELAQTFERLCGQLNDVSLIIAGPVEPGVYADRFEAFLAASEVKHKIHMLGPIFGDVKYDLYRSADVFCTLSRNEGLSLAALEALSQSLPLLITKDSNLPEVQTFAAGVITECNAISACDALAHIFDDPHRLQKMKSNANNLFLTHFAWSVVLPKLTGLYEDISRAPIRMMHQEQQNAREAGAEDF